MPGTPTPLPSTQLDWSKDGQITFCEYLIGMERIIIETAGDEGEEDDDLVGEEEEEEEEDELEVRRGGGRGRGGTEARGNGGRLCMERGGCPGPKKAPIMIMGVGTAAIEGGVEHQAGWVMAGLHRWQQGGAA